MLNITRVYITHFTKKCVLTTVLLMAVLCIVNINYSKASAIVHSAADTTKSDSVYLKVDKLPSFTGGNENIAKFLQKTIKYPAEMEKREIQGRVIVQFIVEKDGTLTDIQALKGLGYGSSEEAVRVMKLSPKWQPGYKDGQPVRTQLKMPVSFVLKKADPNQQPSSGIKLINGG